MKEMIIKVLRENPNGLRKRDIAYLCGVWHLNKEFRIAMTNLYTNDIITSHTVSDPANMEYYEVWKIK